MRKIQRHDVKDIIEYEKIRTEFRRHIIDLKKKRRFTVGGNLTFVFENRETVLFQIEEMIRAERIVREEQIADEINVYNALIPDENELSATLLIEITEQGRVSQILDQFIGLDDPIGRHVWLQFGEERVFAQFEQGRSTGEKISAVHFVRFRFTTEQARRFRSGEDGVYLQVAHPRYLERAPIQPGALAILADDLV